MEKLSFRERSTELWVYPSISSYFDKIKDRKEFFQFLSYADENQNKKPIRIYIHIPFCNKLCSFCAYYKEEYSSFSYEEKKVFYNSLIKELEMYSKEEYMKGRPISTVCIGGGDPSCVEIEFLEKIIKCIYKNFNMSECKGISMEGTVENLLEGNKVSELSRVGVTRLSYGVQTFKPELRKKLGLRCDKKDFYKLADLINKTKIEDYSIDLIYNLPDQSIKDLEEDLNEACEYGPVYMDIHGLDIYPNTEFEKRINDKLEFVSIPSQKKEVEMYKFIMDYLPKKGYKQVSSILYSAKKNRPFIGFERYLRGYEMMPIGPSARGYINRRSFKNVCSVKEYVDLITKNLYPAEIGNVSSEKVDKSRPIIFFPEMTWIEKKDIPDDVELNKKLQVLVNSKYAEWSGDILRLTDKGKVYSGNISRYLLSNEEKKLELRSLLLSYKERKNPYNQDNMGVK